MALINFPNVPNVPGVPAIARSLTVPTSITGLIGFAEGLLTDFLAAQWGIYDDSGVPALLPDSFLEVHFKNDERQADYPMEQGTFASFNKVSTPFDCRVKMSVGSDIISRTAFLAQCDSMLKSTNLYTVITPEASYQNASLVNVLYGRTQRSGVTLIIVELWFQEVRNTAVVLMATPAQPDGAASTNDGQVQAFPVGGPGSVSGTSLEGSAVQTRKSTTSPWQ